VFFTGLISYHRWHHLLGHCQAHVKDVIPTGKELRKDGSNGKSRLYFAKKSSEVTAPSCKYQKIFESFFQTWLWFLNQALAYLSHVPT
jgi:hypothetical protein